MNTFKLEACTTGKQFIFEFSFEDKLGIASNEPRFRYVSYKLYRNDRPPNNHNEFFSWKGRLRVHCNESLELEFLDEINIVGNMRLSVNESNDYIWIDVRYGFRLENHFEGNILKIPEHTPPSK